MVNELGAGSWEMEVGSFLDGRRKQINGELKIENYESFALQPLRKSLCAQFDFAHCNALRLKHVSGTHDRGNNS